MRLLSKLLLAIAFLSFITIQTSVAQEKKKLPKFGKISKEELDMKTYNLDPEARAVILFDRGITDFDLDQFNTNLRRHIRVKILDKTGFDWGDFAIPFYDASKRKIKVKSLKGITMYREADGSIQEAKLDKENIYEESIGEYWRLKKFSMPQLQEGCIIDLMYELESSFINVPEWQFQYDIPVVWSQYETRIPEYFQYRKNFQGYVPITINETTNTTGSINHHVNRERSIHTQNTGRDIQRLEYNIENNFLAMSNIPALKAEPYTSSMSNYYTTVFFELAQVSFPGQFNNNITTSWDDIDESLIQNVNFGGQARKSGFLKDEVLVIKQKHDAPAAQVAAIYEYVKSLVTWNQNYGEYTQNGISKALKDGEGNVGDINLMLTAALRNAGFTADPIVLSTRAHGLIPITRPSRKCFNYVVTGVKLDEGYVYLDATSANSTAGMLPKRCLNGRGRLISKDGCGWVDLMGSKKNDTVVQYDVVMTDDMSLKGELQHVHKDYSAYNCRIKISELGGEDAYVKAIVDENPNLKIHKQTIETSDLYAPVKATFDVTYTDAITDAGQLIYINPMLSEAMTDNPFKAETRQYPVDFAYPIKKTYVFKMPIPEGYTTDELPEKLVLALPEKAGKYTYTAMLNDGVLSVISRFEIRKAIYAPEEYPYLREFYDQAIQKQAEQIVLVKG